MSGKLIEIEESDSASIYSEAVDEIAISISTTTEDQEQFHEAAQGEEEECIVGQTQNSEENKKVIAKTSGTVGEIEESDDAFSIYSEAQYEIAIPISTTTEDAQFFEAEEENDEHRSMYKAASDGNWAKAETLLRENPDLGWMEISDDGDRALHLAVSGENTEFVRNLIDFVGCEKLELYDGNGYTPWCYAAKAGNIEIVRAMTAAKLSVVNVRNMYGTMPSTLAISYGHEKLAKHFLSITEFKGLTREELSDILLRAIANKMFDVAFMIWKKVKDMAGMQCGEDYRTPFHVLAQLDISSGDDDNSGDDDKSSGLSLLTRTLWQKIKILGRDVAVELIQNPPLLHDAAKVGNLDLIDMITRDYSDLLSHIDNDGYSIFHIVVTHRSMKTLKLLRKARDVKNFNALSRDKDDGNNFLHSAAKLIELKGLEIVGEKDVQMQKAFAWFKTVETVAPPVYVSMKNKDGYTPEQLFWKEHAELLTTSQKYMKGTAESCMLISTIVITLVFAAAFAPPGGLNQDTGIPTLLKKKWFTSYIIFQVLALSSSTLSIIGFWSITSSNYEECRFFVLSHYLRLSMCALLLSMLFIISAFLSAFFLVFVDERRVLVLSFMLPLYLVLVGGISYQLFKVLRKTYRLWNDSRMGASSSMFNILMGASSSRCVRGILGVWRMTRKFKCLWRYRRRR